MFTQTIINAKASDSCNPSNNSKEVNFAQCTAQCLKTSQGCSLLEFHLTSQTCGVYSYCTDIMVSDGFTSVRITPRSGKNSMILMVQGI